MSETEKNSATAEPLQFDLLGKQLNTSDGALNIERLSPEQIAENNKALMAAMSDPNRWDNETLHATIRERILWDSIQDLTNPNSDGLFDEVMEWLLSDEDHAFSFRTVARHRGVDWNELRDHVIEHVRTRLFEIREVSMQAAKFLRPDFSWETLTGDHRKFLVGCVLAELPEEKQRKKALDAIKKRRPNAALLGVLKKLSGRILAKAKVAFLQEHVLQKNLSAATTAVPGTFGYKNAMEWLFSDADEDYLSFIACCRDGALVPADIRKQVQAHNAKRFTVKRTVH